MSKKENFIQLVKFTLFSISAGIIQIGSYTLLFEVIHLSHWPSYLISLVLSVLWNFTFNRRFTFKSATNIPMAMLKVALYYLVFTPLSTWWNKALEELGWNNYLLEVGTMLINFVTEYLFCRFVVYRNSMNTNELAKSTRMASLPRWAKLTSLPRWTKMASLPRWTKWTSSHRLNCEQEETLTFNKLNLSRIKL